MKTVEEYYDKNAENENIRLLNTVTYIEYLSTMKLIDRYFPGKSKIIDIGAATGRYSIELSKKGYKATLVDISKVELEIAATIFKTENIEPERIIHCDATRLEKINDDYFDCGLMLGPMYHVIDMKQRKMALSEFYRVLKKNSIGIIGYINSYGMLRSGIHDFPNWYFDSSKIKKMLFSHSYTAEKMRGFTECFWTIPKDAKNELQESGFNILSYAGAESIASGMIDTLDRMKQEKRDEYHNICIRASELCELENYRDCSDHLLFVVRKE
jgi:S-adenosylmethionine-dependent methyltransferase